MYAYARALILSLILAAMCALRGQARASAADGAHAAKHPHYDLVIAGGTVLDGTGGSGLLADVGIVGQRIVTIGHIDPRQAATLVDAHGKVVTPGFINMLSWANEALLVDGRGMSDLKQGVTREVCDVGNPMGALGVGSALINAPGTSADGDELIALARAAAGYGGRYISHLRSEGDHIESALEELIRIARLRDADTRARVIASM